MTTTQLMMLEMVLKFWYTETSLSDKANTQAANGLSIMEKHDFGKWMEEFLFILSASVGLILLLVLQGFSHIIHLDKHFVIFPEYKFQSDPLK